MRRNSLKLCTFSYLYNELPLHPFSKLRDLLEKYSYFKCQFYVTKTAKNSKRKQTVKRHFKSYLIPKLNKNELDNLDIQTKAQYKPSQQKYVP